MTAIEILGLLAGSTALSKLIEKLFDLIQQRRNRKAQKEDRAEEKKDAQAERDAEVLDKLTSLEQQFSNLMAANEADKAVVEERATLRAKESRLAMKLSNATMQLSIVSANALTNGHNNGNVERARKAAEEAQAEYEEFLQSVASKKLAE